MNNTALPFTWKTRSVFGEGDTRRKRIELYLSLVNPTTREGNVLHCSSSILLIAPASRLYSSLQEEKSVQKCEKREEGMLCRREMHERELAKRCWERAPGGSVGG
jgi:hypothetical protein